MKNRVLAFRKVDSAPPVLLLVLLSTTIALAQEHPARVSAVEGSAAIAGESYVDWSEVVVNLPVWEGNRLVLQQQSRVEVELNEGGFLRLDSETDVIFRRLSTEAVELKLLLGSLMLRTHASTPYTVSTDSATISTEKEGLYQISVSASGQTRVSVRKGLARAVHQEGALDLYEGDSFISGEGEYPKAEAEPFAEDDFAYWSDRRDAGLVPNLYDSDADYWGYAGAASLYRHGRWGYHSSYGRVWWPSVHAGWIPYQYGRWIHHPHRGFVWVGYEPWGWLPYHYGQWSYIPYYSRWCWVPGGFSSWSPALVNFYHGNGFIGWSPYGFRGAYTLGKTVAPYSRIPGLTLVPRNRFLDRAISPSTVLRLHGSRGLRSGFDPNFRPFLANSASRRAVRAGPGVVSREVGPAAAVHRGIRVSPGRGSQSRFSRSPGRGFSNTRTGSISRAFRRGQPRSSLSRARGSTGGLRRAGRTSVPRLGQAQRGTRGIHAPAGRRSFPGSRSFRGTAFRGSSRGFSASRSRSIGGVSRSRSGGGRSGGRVGRSRR